MIYVISVNRFLLYFYIDINEKWVSVIRERSEKLIMIVSMKLIGLFP
jgi:hypothetical protein